MYPKWITRAQGIGPVLVTSAAEEKQLLEDWEEQQLEAAEEAVAAAKAEAVATEKVAKTVIPAKR